MELDGKKERPKLNHLPSSPPFFPGSPPLLTSASFHQQLTGDTQWGQRSVDLSPSFLFTVFPCSSVGYSHGLQSLRINVSAWVLHSPQSLPEDLLLHELLSTDCSFLQGTCTSSGMGSFMCCSVDICSDLVSFMVWKSLLLWSLKRKPIAAQQIFSITSERPVILCLL